MPGFDYSSGMKSMPGTWTLEDLNHFLANPQGFVSGTKMTFSGLPRPGVRADVIAYLNTLSDNPAPLPKAADTGGGAKAHYPTDPVPHVPAGQETGRVVWVWP